MQFNIAALGHALLNDFPPGRRQDRDDGVQHPGRLGRDLPQKVVINCTGYGACALSNT